MSNQRTPLPEKTYAITEQDKEVIRDLGRKLIGFFEDHFKGQQNVPFKLIIGAFQYVGDLHDQKVRALGDDFAVVQDAIAKYGLSGRLEEPFSPAPEPEPTEEAAPAATPDPDVEAASIAPSNNAPVAVDPAPAEPTPAPAPVAPAA